MIVFSSIYDHVVLGDDQNSPPLLLPLLLLFLLPILVAMSAGALEGIVWEDQRRRGTRCLDAVAAATELYDSFFK